MTSEEMREKYIGREQAYVKHTILESYLERLFMIIGRGKENVINYVDCFSGPWEAEDEMLGDTSIGISLQIMDKCREGLKNTFGREVKFRALYVEKNPNAFLELQTFLSNNPYPNIEPRCLSGDYTDLLPEIANWCGSQFTFFFVDPKGWQKVIGAKTILPLLKLKKSEFLINLMYDFVNRFVELEQHANDMIELFGEVPKFSNETPDQRRKLLLSLYRQNMKKHYNGRTSYASVEKPGHERVHYFLVYLTRSSVGIKVFKEAAEEMEDVQRITQNEVKLRKQLNRAPIDDMFGSNADISVNKEKYKGNTYEAKEYLLKHISKSPTLIDNERWADFLEDSDLYPTDFQLAMKELVKDGRVINLDADVKRRTKNIIRPNWPDKSERWVLA